MKNSTHVWSDKFKKSRQSKSVVVIDPKIINPNSVHQPEPYERPIKDEFKRSINELVSSLFRLEAERKEKTQRIQEIRRIIAPLEHEISCLQDDIDDAYKSSFNRLKTLRGQVSISDIFAIYEKVESILPWFGWFEDRQTETANWFFHPLDLDRFHWAYAHMNWIQWEDFDDFLIKGETGETIYGIEGGLEIYQDAFKELKSNNKTVVLPPDGCPCIYFLRDRNMRVIYVGQSRSIRSRLTTHLRDRRKGEAEIFEVIRLRSIEDMEREEYRMIKKFSPRLNKFIPKDRWSIGDIDTYKDEIFS